MRRGRCSKSLRVSENLSYIIALLLTPRDSLLFADSIRSHLLPSLDPLSHHPKSPYGDFGDDETPDPSYYDPWPSLWRAKVAEVVDKPLVTKTVSSVSSSSFLPVK